LVPVLDWPDVIVFEYMLRADAANEVWGEEGV